MNPDFFGQVVNRVFGLSRHPLVSGLVIHLIRRLAIQGLVPSLLIMEVNHGRRFLAYAEMIPVCGNAEMIPVCGNPEMRKLLFDWSG